MMSYSRLKFIRQFGWHYVGNCYSKTKRDLNQVKGAITAAEMHVSSPSSSSSAPSPPLQSSSSLYIKHEDTANVRVLQLDLNLSERFKDLQALDTNIKARKMQNKVNVYQLVSGYNKVVSSNSRMV